MGDDRRRSWRDLDRSRDRSGGSVSRRDPDDVGRERARKSGAYGAYKAQLEKMFTPGGPGLPEHLKAQLGPTSDEARARLQLAADLRTTPGDATLRAYLDAGLELPDDARLLMGLLDVLADEHGIRQVIGKLLAIAEGGKRPNRMLLLQKLTQLERRIEGRETLELLLDLRGALE